MRVVVVGAGEVGRTISATLEDSHDVVVVDRDSQSIDEITYAYDVLAIQGDGTEISTLRKAGIEQADLVVACTDTDESNIVICTAAKSRSNAFTIARVRRRSLLETWEGANDSFGIDFMICSDHLTAQTVFRISGFPAAQNVDSFVGGRIRMAVFEIEPDSPIAHQTITEADRYDSLTFIAVFCEDRIELATGDTVLEPSDRVVVVGRPEPVRKFANQVATHVNDAADEVVIAGASEIGIQTAKAFEEHGYHPRLLERNTARARYASEQLPGTTVLEHDATDREFLSREHIGEADILISAFETDERNLLMSLLGRHIGVDKTVAIVESFQYSELFETVGVDITVNPREETAEEIVKFTRENHTEKIVTLEHDRAEVFEIKVTDDSIFTNREIEAAMSELPDGVIIGAISRSGEFVTPEGVDSY